MKKYEKTGERRMGGRKYRGRGRRDVQVMGWEGKEGKGNGKQGW